MKSFHPYLTLGAMAAFVATALLSARQRRTGNDRQRETVSDSSTQPRQDQVVVHLRGEKSIEVDHFPKGDPSTVLITVWLC